MGLMALYVFWIGLQPLSTGQSIYAGVGFVFLMIFGMNLMGRDK